MEDQYELQLNKPEPFNPSKNNTSASWRIWKQNFLIYLELTQARLKLSESGLAFFLLNLIGPVGIEAKENMTFDDPSEEENMEILLKKFDEIFDPPLNEIEERYKFFSRRKYDTETIQNYVTCLKEQAAKCNFNKQTDKFILDMVVLNMDDNLQQRIFLAKDLTLPMAIKLFEEHLMQEEKVRNVWESNFDNLHNDNLTDAKEAYDYFLLNIKKQENKAHDSKDQTSAKEKANKNNSFQPRMEVYSTCFEVGHFSEECNKVQNNFDRQQSSKYRVDYQSQSRAVNVCSECGTHHQLNMCPARKKHNNTKRTCFRCNSHHPPKQCPAYNVTCFKCHKLGHFDHACKSKQFQESSDDSDDSDDSDLSTEAQTVNQQPRRRRRRRQRRNRQPKNDESCCIS